MSAKWFKHYADAHRGRSMTELMEQFGHMGPSCYWILVGMCTEKFWEQAKLNPKTPLKKLPCLFRFHRRTLTKDLATRPKQMLRWLGVCSKLGLLSFNSIESISKSNEADVSCFRNEFEIEIVMPKLFEILARDQKRARDRRGLGGDKRRDLKPKTTKPPKAPKPQNPETEIENDPDQLLLPGLLKPSAEKTARELVAETIARNNTALNNPRKSKGLTPAKDVISEIITQEDS